MPETALRGPISFVCPKCKSALRSTEKALQCSECNRTYPLVGDIPDFISESSSASIDPSDRGIRFFNILAPIYESWLWQTFFLALNGGAGKTSLQSIAGFMAETLRDVTGNVLDVACGPATYARRMVSPDRNIYGIDFSMGMLRQGKNHITRDGVSGVHLARTRVEELPFENAIFDGAICGGSLHLFPDTMLALREIARTLKAGAPLAVTTVVAGNSPGARSMKRHGGHAFELSELQQYLSETRFEGFTSKQDGTFITFSTRKAAPRI